MHFARVALDGEAATFETDTHARALKVGEDFDDLPNRGVRLDPKRSFWPRHHASHHRERVVGTFAH